METFPFSFWIGFNSSINNYAMPSSLVHYRTITLEIITFLHCYIYTFLSKQTFNFKNMAQETCLNATAAAPPKLLPPQQWLSLSVVDNHYLSTAADDGNNKRRKAGSKHSATSQENLEQQYLANCLVKLARSGGRGRRPDTATPTTATASTSKAAQAEETELIQCSICGKTFPTYQALGGHKSGHRNRLVVSQNNKKINSSNFTAAAAAAKGVSKPSKKSHKCEICLKKFPNGQALGGHKRSHLEILPLRTLDLYSGGPAISDPSHLPTAKVITASGGATLSDSGPSSRDQSEEEIDLELRLGSRIIGLKTKNQAVENHELESPTPSKKLCLSLFI